MPGLGVGQALWAVVLPAERTNLLPNPSAEYGNVNITATSAGVQINGTSSAYQVAGAWSILCVPNSGGTSGLMVGSWQSGNGTAYSASSYVRGAVGQNYCMCVVDASTLAVAGSTNFDGGGTWQRYNMSYTETGDTTRRLMIRKTSGAGVGSYWIDASQVEVGSLTSYFDGDTAGCSWNAAVHNSQSYRSSQVRTGGSVIALADLGLQVNDMLGAGVGPIEVSSQSYAVIDGAQFQRQRGAQRKFTLTGKPVNGTSTADYHVTRRTLYDAFKPDLVSPQQPVRFIYVGGQGTQQLDGYYDSGLELGNMDGPMAENLGVSFIATDPYWYSPTSSGTTLSPRLSLGSLNYIARRSPQGVWGTVGASGSTLQGNLANAVYSFAIPNSNSGTVFIGGFWGTIAGTVFPGVCQYYPASNTFGTLGGGGTVHGYSIPGTVYALAMTPDAGTLVLGGDFQKLGGTTAVGLGIWQGNTFGFGSLVGGTISGANAEYVRALIYNNAGSLWMGGSFSSINGTVARHLAFWQNGTAGTPTGGSIGGPAVFALAQGGDGRIFFGGNFSQAFGQTSRFIGYWNGAGGTLAGGTLDTGVHALATGLNGVENIGGLFTTIDTSSALRVTSWNGVSYRPLGNGLNGDVRALAVDPLTGALIAGGKFSAAGGVLLAGGLARYNGNVWASADLDLDSLVGTVFAIKVAPDRSLYIGGRFFGTAYASAVGTVVNPGRAKAYPTVRLRNLSASGTAFVWRLANLTTNDGIDFNYRMQAGEVATLDFTPGNRSFRSSFQGNVFGSILPGSNLTTFGLLSGPNLISFFSDNDSLEVSIFWQPKGWAADSGTVY